VTEQAKSPRSRCRMASRSSRASQHANVTAQAKAKVSEQAKVTENSCRTRSRCLRLPESKSPGAGQRVSSGEGESQRDDPIAGAVNVARQAEGPRASQQANVTPRPRRSEASSQGHRNSCRTRSRCPPLPEVKSPGAAARQFTAKAKASETDPDRRAVNVARQAEGRGSSRRTCGLRPRRR